MSGIYIKGMKMPKERESFTLTIKYNGTVLDTETGMQVAEAQEVPPHGRCIDADAFEKHIKEDWEEYDHWIAVEVENRPTIIEAEEGE